MLLVLLLILAGGAVAQTPDALRRGISITNWFRFPPSAEPAALRNYLSDDAMAALRHAGFSFVRLPVQPEVLRIALLIEAIRRLQAHGLAVVIDAHPASWQLETSAADRAALLAFWQALAPALRPLDPHLTFPELLNEPVFPGAAAQWQALQHELLLAVRTILPHHTLILTGGDWGSIAGLRALQPDADGNVVYSFHFYEPPELTALAAYRSGLDRAALAHLPFPADPDACARRAPATADAPTAGLIRFYCTQGWNSTRIDRMIAGAADWGARNHAALLLGEFGATAALDAPARLAWLRTVRQAAESHGIGWALWGYDDVMGFHLKRPPGPNPRLDAAVLAALGLAAAPEASHDSGER